MTEKNKGGRPTTVPGGLPARVTIRFTATERDQIDAAAQREGLTRSEFIRQAALAKASEGQA